jgi:fatty acid desaturase
MLLRHRADWRTLVWAFALFPAVALAPYAYPRLLPWILPLSLYLGFCAGVFSHNQNHCPTFKSRRVNAFYAAWLSIFYLFPTYVWIPSHNLNHHKYVNKAGDATITWRYSKRNTWIIASSYYFVSAFWQKPVLDEYVAKAKAGNRALYRQIITQQVTVASAHVGLLVLAIALHGWKVGGIVYGLAVLVPALFANWSMIFINYIQHVHTDPWSEHNHSRNFVSKLGNWLVFNNGYHTAHHESAGLHWSKLAVAHAKIAHLIDPELNQSSIFGFCFRAYLFGIFNDRFRTHQVGRAPYDPPNGAAIKLQTAEVSAVEAGVNEAMA